MKEQIMKIKSRRSKEQKKKEEDESTDQKNLEKGFQIKQRFQLNWSKDMKRGHLKSVKKTPLNFAEIKAKIPLGLQTIGICFRPNLFQTCC